MALPSQFYHLTTKINYSLKLSLYFLPDSLNQTQLFTLLASIIIIQPFLHFMNHQQIVAFADLASNYNQTKYNNINNCNWHPTNAFSTIANMDTAVFRRTVQEKIKVKYQESRHLKTSPQAISKTLGFKPEEQTYKARKKIVIHTEGSEKTTFPQPCQILSHSQMHKHDSLQRFINKKQHSSFLEKSNLLIGPPSTSFKERKCINSHLKTQNSIFKDLKKSNIMSKRQDFANKLRQQVTNFGYQMDGSIYHFQDNRSITIEQPSLKSSVRSKESQTNKEQVYSMLRNTSPLNVQKKLMREKRTSGTYQAKEVDLAGRIQKVRQSFKLSNKKHKNELKQTAFSKMIPSFSKQSNSFFLRSKEDDISGWQHDEQS